MTTPLRRGSGYLLAMMLAFGSFLIPVASLTAQDTATPTSATPVAGSATPMADDTAGDADLDVLFIGAHPDDEAFGLSTYGQWNEFSGLETGVITITRGEGGGNAVGTEEGPALGLLRELEERRAVAPAGIDHIYNLDKVDFYYTVSAPLTEEVWDYDDTLERIVRVIRSTTPEVIVTMNPAPTPGNHGHHQVAARLAVDAYAAAGDSNRFTEQLQDEGLVAWAPSKVFRGGFSGESEVGSTCNAEFAPTGPTDIVYGVWSGVASERNDGRTWAAVERDSQREYASQGWAVFPDVSEDPEELGCDYFTLVDSRVPYTLGNTEPTAMVEGTLTDTTGGLPAGTIFDVQSSSFDVVAGEPFTLDAVVGSSVTGEISIEYDVPEGWTVSEGESQRGRTLYQTVEITPAEDAEAATRYRIVANLSIDGATGQSVEVVEVAPPVQANLEPLPQIAQFREWVQEVNAPQLDSLIKPVVSIGVGETREVDVTVTNNTDEAQTASVTVVLVEGFEADEETKAVPDLAGGESTTVTFAITNTDDSLATSVEGGIEGDYLLDIRTVGAGVATTEQAGLNLVPVVSVPASAGSDETPDSATPVADSATPVASGGAPAIDGVISEREYASQPIDISRVWEGDEPDSADDASGTAWLSYDDNGIYVAVEVVDEARGTILTAEDAKRHWRTDSVEIAIDPLGAAENTSGTFKVGIFPEVEGGGPAASRDADAFQGPIAETAPGMEVTSSVTDPYTGYVIETFIPYDALPAPVDPDGLAMNIFIYDSDTDDLTGQTRLGWSVWGGVQGDPYRWAQVTLEDYTATDGGELAEPRIPLEAAQSASSPWSIIQSASDGVGLAGLPVVPAGEQMSFSNGPSLDGGEATATITGGDAGGTVQIFAVSGDQILAEWGAELEAGDAIDVSFDVGQADPATITLAASLVTEDGSVQAVAAPVSP